MNLQNLTRIFSTTDLGVTFTARLQFDAHINTITNQAFRNLEFIKRNTADFDFEFASIIWYPETKQLINQIEKVQNYFLKYLYFKRYKCNPPFESYRSIREQFKIPKLYYRRDVKLLIFMYKIINNFIDNSYLLSLFRIHVPYYSLRPGPPMSIILNQLSPVNMMSKTHNKYYNQLDISMLPINRFIRQVKNTILQY